MADYKNFMELSKDLDACKKIFEFVFNPPYGKYTGIEVDDGFGIDIKGTFTDGGKTFSVYISMWKDGDVYFIENEKDGICERFFQFVDFVRSLGYSNV